ncbi:MAG TPA: hypothetical protein VM305_10385 [Candidatus Limnocylindrales bacterium]|nr:hypothetical protein [Candidatus Limnocylindrales bacterium]
MRLIVLAAALTAFLGASVAASFLVVGGPMALRGPVALQEAWAPIYGLIAVSAAVVGYLLGRPVRRHLGYFEFGVAVAGAWIGEYIVLASSFLDNDLNPFNAVHYWVFATAGPLQPLAALARGWLALGRRTVGEAPK